MDISRDGKIDLKEMHAFVGKMGGMRQVLHHHQQKVGLGHKYAAKESGTGIEMGDRVMSYFYVEGKKSYGPLEATVLQNERKFRALNKGKAVRIEEEVHIKVEFGFTHKNSTNWGMPWKATQDVPISWIVSSLPDSEAAGILRELGILDPLQSFFYATFPKAEVQELRRLEDCQCDAVRQVHTYASANHRKALPQVLQRFETLGLSDSDLNEVLRWVQDLAPIVIHVDIDKMGQYLAVEDNLRHHLNDKVSDERDEWERDLFGSSYDTAKFNDRCKHASLNILNDYRGVTSTHSFGDSYLELKDVRLRSTFVPLTVGDCTDMVTYSLTGPDSSGGASALRIGMLDCFAHVLQDFSDREILAVARVATAPEVRHPSERPKLLSGPSKNPEMQRGTFGYPEWAQKDGCHYFEVEFVEGWQTAQVGLLSKTFKVIRSASAASETIGIGDDEHGWGVDSDAGFLHNGSTKPCKWHWPVDEEGFAQKVIIGCAVDLCRRRIWLSSDGNWDDALAFEAFELPIGVELYPAVSFKGRAFFSFGPYFHHSPPSFHAEFSQWPGAPEGKVAVGMPWMGDSSKLARHVQTQVHGRVSLKEHVHRLVANTKYMDNPNNSDAAGSSSIQVTGAGPRCSTLYERAKGLHMNLPFYRSAMGGVIYCDTVAKAWRISDTEDFTKFVFEADQGFEVEPPREGWTAAPSAKGTVSKSAFETAVTEAGLDADACSKLITELQRKDVVGKAPPKDKIQRQTNVTSFEQEWSRLPLSAELDAAKVWDAAVIEVQHEFLVNAGFATEARMVETQHPYPMKPDSWVQSVCIPGASSLKVVLSCKCTSVDEDSCFKITAGAYSPEEIGRKSKHGVYRLAQIPPPVFQAKGKKGWNVMVPEIPGDTVTFHWETDGYGDDLTSKWGWLAIVCPGDSSANDRMLDDEGLCKATELARGVGNEVLRVFPDRWDEQRLRSLCAVHGWEFAWMEDDGYWKKAEADLPQVSKASRMGGKKVEALPKPASKKVGTKNVAEKRRQTVQTNGVEYSLSDEMPDGIEWLP
jgi:hypothetical protein